MRDENRESIGQPGRSNVAETSDSDPTTLGPDTLEGDDSRRGGGDDKARSLGGKPDVGGYGRPNINESESD